MPAITIRNLNDVSRTLLIPLHLRAQESGRPDAIIRDPKALELVGRLDCDLSSVVTPRTEAEQVSMLLRMREFDRMAKDFLIRHPDGTVVDLGCGLDTRFERIDNGRMEWYGVDLPEVIELRKELLDETPRSHFIGCSVLDLSWMDVLGGRAGKPVLFLAEAVLYYLKEAGVKTLVRAFAGRFPGAELAFDAFSPLVVRCHPRTPDVPPVHWGLGDDRELEAWAPGIRLTGRSYYLEQPEPRLGAFRIFRYLPFLGRVIRIVQYRLGERQAKNPGEET
jgi:O-methyltransferase involved in polyketide biosynthesis